jgi:hypothetical protein
VSPHLDEDAERLALLLWTRVGDECAVSLGVAAGPASSIDPARIGTAIASKSFSIKAFTGAGA